MAGEDRGKKKGKGGGNDQPPPAPKPPAGPWWLAAFKEFRNDILGLLGFGMKAAVAYELLGTEEGRGLVGEVLTDVRLTAQAAIRATITMVRTTTIFTIYVGFLALIQLIMSGKMTHYQVRIPAEAIMFMVVVISVIVTTAVTSRWWLAKGMIEKGAESLKEAKLIESLKWGNPMPLLFTSAQPTVQGGLDSLWGFGQFMARVIVHFAISTVVVCQPFHQAPIGLWFAPEIIMGLVMLSTGYPNEMKWHLWFVYINGLLVLLGAISLLAWNPWMLGYFHNSVFNGLLMSTIIAVLVTWLVKHSSTQSRDHRAQMAAKDGKSGAVAAVSPPPKNNPWHDGSSAKWVFVGMLCVMVVVALAISGFISADKAELFDRIRPVGQDWFLKHHFSAYPGRMSGIDAIQDAKQPVSCVTVPHPNSGQNAVMEYQLTLSASLGPLDSQVNVQDGDVVEVVVTTETYNVKDDQGALYATRLGGSLTANGVKTPQNMPDQRLYWTDYPAVRLAYGAMLSRLGKDGPFRLTGQHDTFTVEGGGLKRLYFYLNLPQRPQFEGAVDGEIKLTVLVTRQINK